MLPLALTSLLLDTPPPDKRNLKDIKRTVGVEPVCRAEGALSLDGKTGSLGSFCIFQPVHNQAAKALYLAGI
jgi:hypothetical protein